MTKEDALDAEIAELFDEVTTTKVEMVNGKPRISDQATLDQMEREEDARRMEEACGLFLTREREFQRIAQHPRVVTDPQMNVLWWDRLEAVYVAEKAVTEQSEWASTMPRLLPCNSAIRTRAIFAATRWTYWKKSVGGSAFG